LSASTVYDWQVRTNCSSGSSGYSSAQFTTATASTCATAFEPNETLATGAAISSGVANSAAISSSTDIDYYKITVSATSNIVYNLAGPSGVDYDLYIYNSAGTQLGSGAGSTATESVSLSSQAAGTYYIKVLGYNGATSATCYTITATATTATGCQSTYDVSTNGTTSGAAVIPFNTNITGLISPSADVDDYKFTITTGGTITVTLTTLPGDYDIKLLNSAGTQVGISQNGSTTSETISYTAAAGVYYVSVYGYNGANSATSCYTLKVQLGTATKQVTDIPVYAADKNVMTVYPNPVSDVLNIALSSEVSANSSFVMMDAKGVVVMQQKFIRNPQAVDISKLTNGVYLVKINNGGKVITEKFIKQ
jgi:Secretion system C-terminal sorting domain/Bacterial pre-peptidase C-terminal domain